MTYQPNARIQIDGIWRPEHHFASATQWVCVRYVEHNRQRIERQVWSVMEGKPIILGPIQAIDACDELNRTRTGRIAGTQGE